MPALITNYHVLSKDDIAEGKKIKFALDKGNVQKEILITNERKIYSNENFDVTIIQLNPSEDYIEPNSFLDVESKIINCNDPNKEFRNKEIYIIGNIKEYTYGIIKSIDEEGITIRYSFSTKPGMSGSPIINMDNYKVIGIHKGSDPKKIFNLGTFLKQPFEQFFSLKDNFLNNKNNNKNKESIEHSAELKKDVYKIPLSIKVLEYCKNKICTHCNKCMKNCHNPGNCFMGCTVFNFWTKECEICGCDKGEHKKDNCRYEKKIIKRYN